jgi:hypothetical protein
MRPFPVHPRGPRKRRKRRETVLLGCQRSSPEWELGALHALMKPKPVTRSHIEHRTSEQPWPPDGERRVRELCTALAGRLGVEIAPEFPAGDYWMAVPLPAAAWPEDLAIARALSLALPGCWLTIGRVFVLDGVFHNRERGFKLTLVPSKHHRVPAVIARKVRDLTPSPRRGEGRGEGRTVVRRNGTG